MKKIVFVTMLLCMAVSAFAKNDDSNNKIKVNEREAPNCKDRGGNCLVIINLGGVSREYKVCCMDVRVVTIPGGNN